MSSAVVRGLGLLADICEALPPKQVAALADYEGTLTVKEKRDLKSAIEWSRVCDKGRKRTKRTMQGLAIFAHIGLDITGKQAREILGRRLDKKEIYGIGAAADWIFAIQVYDVTDCDT